MPAGTYLRLLIGGKISPADNWRLQTWWQLSGGVPSDSDLQSTIDALYSSFGANFWNFPTNPWKFMNSSVTDLSSMFGYVYSDGVLVKESAGSGASAIVGTGASNKPAYCAVCFSLKTAAFGRSARGRAYLPATAGTISAATLQWSVLQAHCDQFRSFLRKDSVTTPVSTQAVVMSMNAETAPIARPITQVQVDTLPDTQRGRQSKAVASSRFSSLL